MKKILTAVLAALVAFAFTGCMSLGATLGTSTKNKKEYQEAVGTPQDSVIFYGCFSKNEYQAFSQINQDFPPDFQEMENQIFISKPVAPGSVYALEWSKGEYSYTVGRVRYTYYWNTPFSLQLPLNPVVINIPEKPGLYYVGSFDATTVKEGEKAQPMNSSEDYEIGCLKGALKLYKGTSWEAAINERIEELKNAK
ncbi:hypothetical protein [Treponema sp.]|uniref:hypothetical protein n=1 Tax=Treponema sp. TaxID=166 RepID=UPI00388D1912